MFSCMGKALDGSKSTFASLDTSTMSEVVFVIAQHSRAGTGRLDKHVFADTYTTNR